MTIGTTDIQQAFASVPPETPVVVTESTVFTEEEVAQMEARQEDQWRTEEDQTEAEVGRRMS